jgi:methionyl-tRNA formyltransferase
LEQLRTIFAGTPDFAVASLDALFGRAEIKLLAVYTQPDRPAGRGRKLKQSAIKMRATTAGVEVRQPENFKQAIDIEALADLRPDLMVVAAYGLILPRAVLDAARISINVHASLLPRWRGAAPIQRAIMAGDATTGISIMRIVESLDAGPVWLQRDCAITPTDTAGSLHDKLALLGGVALTDALDDLAQNAISETKQDEAGASYAAKISRQDRMLDWSRSASELERQIRALSPFPGAHARIGNVDAKILAAVIENSRTSACPGSVTASDSTGLAVATGTDDLRITRLQPTGRQPMAAEAFVNGYRNLL